MNKHQKYVLTNIWQLTLAFGTCFLFVLSGLIANQVYFGGPAEPVTHDHVSTFMLRVASDGATTVTAMEDVSEEVREDLRGVVFASPDAFFHRVEGPYPGNAADAHAVNVCYHGDGKVSRDFGYSRHLTWFRYHENDRHYTTTAHQVLNQAGWTTVDIYKTNVSRAYCGCG